MSSSSNRSFLVNIAKLNGANWYEWKKVVSTYLMMEGLLDIINGTSSPSEKEFAEWTKRDQRVFGTIFFLIEDNYRSPIFDLESGHAAWKALIAEYEKDTSSARIQLRQSFYSTVHNPATGVSAFINDILTISRRLNAIGHKPSDIEIADKILIGLHSSFAPVRTTLTLQSPQPALADIIAAIRLFETNELLRPSDPSVVRDDKGALPGDEALHAGSKGRGGGRRGQEGDDDEYDWGNTKKRDGACWRCGKLGHFAQNCVADMPADVKKGVLTSHAHGADVPYEEIFAFSALAVGSRPRSPSPAPSVSPSTTSSSSLRGGGRARGFRRGGRRGGGRQV